VVVGAVRPGLLPPSLAKAVSPHIGLVKEIHETTVEPGLPRLVNVAASPANTKPITGAQVNTRPGSCHFTRSQAWCAAVGETIERFSAAYAPSNEITVGTAWDIGPAAVNPDVLRLYRTDPPPGSGYHNPGWKSKFGWCYGTALADGAPRALPAQLVYLGYHLAPGEPRLGMLTSSGLCCERSLPAAVLGGLLEQIERDAILSTWRLKIGLPKLDWRTDPAFARIEKLMRGVRPELELMDASAFLGVPVVMSVIRDQHATHPVGIVVGASAGLNVTDAAESAFREGFQTLLMASLISRGQDGGADEIFDDHVARFVPVEAAGSAAFLTGSTEVVHSSSVQSFDSDCPLDALKAVTNQLAKRDIEAIGFDLTTDEVAALDLHVARVVCPQLVWLDVDFDRPFDGRPRLDAVARAFGLPLDRDGRAIFNYEPHPLP
jgi:ribosomal protein S12 methylthiotransferase accessory factor